MWQCTPSAPRSKNVGLDFILGSVCSGFDVPGSVCCVPVLPTGIWTVVVIHTNIVRMTPCIEPDHANSLLQLLLVMIFIV
jgi:hypothetical protein